MLNTKLTLLSFYGLFSWHFQNRIIGAVKTSVLRHNFQTTRPLSLETALRDLLNQYKYQIILNYTNVSFRDKTPYNIVLIRM